MPFRADLRGLPEIFHVDVQDAAEHAPASSGTVSARAPSARCFHISHLRTRKVIVCLVRRSFLKFGWFVQVVLPYLVVKEYALGMC